jgi:hypothetical protein
MVLQITYFGFDANRHFDIIVNNIQLAEVYLDGKQGDVFYTVDYPVTEDMLKAALNGKLKLLFKARDNSVAGGIYYVRLLKSDK